MRILIVLSALLAFAAAWPYTEKQELSLQNVLHNTGMDYQEGQSMSFIDNGEFTEEQDEYAEDRALERRVNSMKGPSAGDVIAGIELTIGLLKSILDMLGSINRKIAIGVENHTGKTWTASSSSIYFVSGTSDNVLPYKVPDTKALLEGCRKTSGPAARGTVGVFTYTLSDGNTIAVMWSVPFDYNLYSNWWNVLAFRGKKYANKKLFDHMYSWDGNPFKGDNEWKIKNLDLGYKVRGAMAGSGQATMEIRVEKR